MPVRDIDWQVVRRDYRILRNVRLIIVIAAHPIDRQHREKPLQFPRVVRIVAQVDDRVRLLPLDRCGHSDIPSM